MFGQLLRREAILILSVEPWQYVSTLFQYVGNMIALLVCKIYFCLGELFSS